ncbi:MAG TPA: TRAM domain-containing protein [Vicinamibacterales bacterium]|nr:TRAM domain-containing protein [Vicinamibacterales bacterium]
MNPGQTLSLSIEKPAAGGRMIARVEGQVVLVANAIPGERVTARIERVGRGVAYADAVGVEDGSPDRRAAVADPSCGGCLYSHITYERQLAIKGLVIEDAFARIAHLPLPAAPIVAGSPEHGYRMRARVHVREGQVGFFREGTHDLCEVRSTGQLRSDTCDTLDRLAAGLRSLGMAGVREIEVSENIDASQRVVHLDTAVALAPRVLGGLGLSEGLTGLTVSTAPGRGPRAAVVSGSPHVVEVLGLAGHAVRLQRHVLSFFQGNRFLLQALVDHVVGQVSPGDRVIDLYAGAGLFAVSAAVARDAQVIAVEGERASADDLASNAAATGGRVKAVHEPVEVFAARQHNPPAVLIVDPPRTGMSREALEGILRWKAAALVYVSCDVATLARDARKLVDAGYLLDRLVGFDLFPNTPHVECVATFKR